MKKFFNLNIYIKNININSLKYNQKFKERELSTKEGYDDQDSGVSTSALENFKIDKTSQN